MPTRDHAHDAVANWDGKSEQSLRDALRPPTEKCVETHLLETGRGEAAPTAGDDRRLSLTLTTKAAYRTPVVKVFVNAMADRTELSEDLHERIYSAAQEALMNAVMHGNLRIDASLRNSVQNLMFVHETIEHLLATPDFADLAIRVEASWSATSLNVTVTDCGDGFVKTSPPTQPAVNEGASGRGLSILAAMCDEFQLNDGGRVATMRFSR